MNFKSLREDKLKLSKEDFALMLEITVSEIERLEVSNAPDINLIQKIALNTGLDFNTILAYEKPKPKAFDAKNTWEKADFTKKSVIDYIEDALEKMNIPEKQKAKYITDLQNGIEQNLVKPSISIVGRSDTGKSTLINALLGMEKMPTSWTPTTSIAVYIKHVKDRPSFINEDAWVFADSVDGEDLWDAKKLYDKEYCEKWKIAQGEVDILREFGTRQGEMFQKNAGSAVVFLDAQILLDCDIVDLPGFGTEKESDDMITFRAAQRTDILIYLSQANGFMRIEDITYLKENVRNLPAWEKKGENELKPLSNLFVVASQAHTIGNGNTTELNNILKKGFENFCKTLAPAYWERREEATGYKNYGGGMLPQRFFTYTIDIPVLCTRFNNELKAILEVLPEIIDKRTKLFIKEYVKTRKPNLEAEIKKYEELIEEREKYVDLLQQIEDSELQRTQNNDSQKQKIKELINTLSMESRDEFSKYCSEIINTDALVSKMKAKGIKNKKEEVECFASQLQDELQAKCNSILEAKSNVLSEETKKYIEKFEESIKVAFDKSSVDVDFDAGFAFASSLAKIGIIGGLGAYIASNAAFLFGSMTFILGLGGDIALGAAVFGPIGIAIGLIIAASLGIAKLFGGSWEKSVAKKIVKAYDDNGVVEKFRSGINNYWTSTDAAFVKAAQALDEEWEKYVDTLRDTVNNYNVEEISNSIVTLKNLMGFFANIPL
ncbi:MAG: dynamin family protein [Lachnospiraceae bacterium]|nr:dynamin family protein [Lachnospiraceae bacterium]